MSLGKRVKDTVLLVAKLGIAVALLGWLVHSGKLEPDKIWAAVSTNPLWLGFALMLYNVCIVLTANRWRMLLVSQGIPTPRRDCVVMTYIGCFFSCFLPGGTGGDFVKAYYVARDSHKRAEAATTVFLDRVLGLYCMVGLAAVAILFRIGHLWHYGVGEGAKPVLLGLTRTQLLTVGVLTGFCAATIGFIIFLSSHCRRLVHWLLGHLPHRLGGILKRVYESVYLYRGHKRLLAKFALYSVSAHGLAAVVLCIVGLSLHDPVASGGTRALNYFFLIPLGLVLNGLPLAPAGVGVFEWALGFLFATVLVAGESNVGPNVAALGHVIIILTNLIGLIFYLKGKRRVTEAIEQAQHDGDAPLPDPNADA